MRAARRLSVAPLVGQSARERCPHDVVSQPGCVAAAAEQPHQPTGLRRRFDTAQGAQFAGNQPLRCCPLGIGIDLGHRGGDDGVGHPAPAQLLRHRTPGQAPFLVLGEGIAVGQGGVVDQTDGDKPVEHRAGGGVRNALAPQRRRQLGPRPGSLLEQPQADKPGDRLWISRRTGVIRFGSRAVRSSAPAHRAPL